MSQKGGKLLSEAENEHHTYKFSDKYVLPDGTELPGEIEIFSSVKLDIPKGEVKELFRYKPNGMWPVCQHLKALCASSGFDYDKTNVTMTSLDLEISLSKEKTVYFRMKHLNALFRVTERGVMGL